MTYVFKTLDHTLTNIVCILIIKSIIFQSLKYSNEYIKQPLSISFRSRNERVKMIATVCQMIYIVNVHNEHINEKTIQKGRAISKLDNSGNFQIYQYCQFLPNHHSDTNAGNSDFEDDDESIHEIKQNKVYQITGKFSPLKDNIIDIVITTSKRLNLVSLIALQSDNLSSIYSERYPNKIILLKTVIL